MNTKKILIGLAIVAAVVILLRLRAVAPPEPTALAQTPHPSMLVLINQVRAKAGKAPLQEDLAVGKAAKLKVNDQIARNYWSHIPPTGESPYTFLNMVEGRRLDAGENLAKCGYSDQQAVYSWTNSPGHYATMIGDYNYWGTASAVNPKDNNCVYIVNYFIKK